ncbi:phosphoribosyltransferase family protein [Patescibacteria group bacterium]
MLVVDDVLTTGGSVRGVVEAVRKLGGYVVGVGVIANRGQVTAKDVGDVSELFALADVTMDSYPEKECPLCKKGVPINTVLGKGQEFLARRAG